MREYREKQKLLSCKANSKTNSKANVSRVDIDIEEDIDKDKDIIDKPKTARHKYGLYKNVLLSDDDLTKLKAEFVDWEQRIERLSEYIASTGKSYKNHLATIRAWARKEKPQNKVGANGIVVTNAKSDLEGVF
jgi:hypothetical protein